MKRTIANTALNCVVLVIILVVILAPVAWWVVGLILFMQSP